MSEGALAWIGRSLTSVKGLSALWMGWRYQCSVIVSGKWSRRTFDAAILFNAILAIVECAMRFNDDKIAAFNIANKIVYIIFMIELFVKVSGLGITRFWRGEDRVWNRLDVVAMSAATIWRIFDLDDVSAVNFGRIFTFSRSFRLLHYMLRTSKVIFALLHVLPGLMRYVAVLFCLFYIFALVGMEAFAGRLNLSNPSPQRTSFHQLRYAYSFDTFPDAIVALFGQMVVNQWPVLVEGCAAATSSALSQPYFVSWYFCSVIVVLNLLLAFLIESYNLHVSFLNASTGKNWR